MYFKLLNPISNSGFLKKIGLVETKIDDFSYQAPLCKITKKMFALKNGNILLTLREDEYKYCLVQA